MKMLISSSSSSKIKRLFSSKSFLLIFLILLVVGFGTFGLVVNKRTQDQNKKISQEQKQAQSKQTGNSSVLGSNTQVPQIYISGGEQGYSTGGMIALASTDEPAVVIGGYNIFSDAEILIQYLS